MGRTIEIYCQYGDNKGVHYSGVDGSERMRRLIDEVKELNRRALERSQLFPYCWRWREDGREIRQQIQSIAECPECGKDVDCIAETESNAVETGEHIAYGPPHGVCCGYLIFDGFEGAEVYKLQG